ncbi:MAG: hypothetical protein ABSE72_12425 [Bacteroidales bacterium]|jgi:hypothetical protein
MNNFNQFGITVTAKSFVGDKIKILKILGKEIVVHDHKIEESKVQAFRERGADKCLHLQISINDVKHILFTSSGPLIEMIQQIPATGFPFTTTIIEDNDRYIFT